MRIGIGHPGDKNAVHNYVLSKPSKNDQELISKGITKSLDAFPNMLSGNWDKAMQSLHTS